MVIYAYGNCGREPGEKRLKDLGLACGLPLLLIHALQTLGLMLLQLGLALRAAARGTAQVSIRQLGGCDVLASASCFHHRDRDQPMGTDIPDTYPKARSSRFWSRGK